MTFEVLGGSEGRIIYFWRTNGASVINNTFKVGDFAYSATSSGNDNGWLSNGELNCIRKNVVIRGNKVFADGKELGSEGIGLADFDGAVIEGNEIVGVGDDPIGVHYSRNLRIVGNTLKSVDGRLFVSNSRDVEILSNRVERMSSLRDGHFYQGIALIYIGFETLDSNERSAPSDTLVYDNDLHYPPGAIDGGAAIYLYGPRNVIVEKNRIVNQSPDVTATALHLLPARFSGQWTDPESKDPRNVARVWKVDVVGNVSEGTYPLPLIMTGNCAEYRGPVAIRNNTGPDFRFYCDVQLSNNKMPAWPTTRPAFQNLLPTNPE